jgi:hypothetical protein
MKYAGTIPARFEIKAMKLLDAWAKGHGVTRSEAIRRLVEIGLKAGKTKGAELDKRAVKKAAKVIDAMAADLSAALKAKKS